MSATDLRDRAKMFLLGWFGAVFDDDETSELCDLLAAFAEHVSGQPDPPGTEQPDIHGEDYRDATVKR